jgi:hypothetical protein
MVTAANFQRNVSTETSKPQDDFKQDFYDVRIVFSPHNAICPLQRTDPGRL